MGPQAQVPLCTHCSFFKFDIFLFAHVVQRAM